MNQVHRLERGKLNDRGAVRDTAQYMGSDGCVLFDFDGPLCTLFPDGSSAPLAEELRRIVVEHDAGGLLLGEAGASIDPQVVLKTVYRYCPRSALATALEDRLGQGEVAATAIAQPTPGAEQFVRRLRDAHAKVAVVTNNAPAAVTSYLRRVRMDRYFKDHIYGRTEDPGQLKPHPDSIYRALAGLGVDACGALMIGDMPTDLYAAREAKVAFVGFVRDEAGAAELWGAGAELVVSRMELLSAVIPRTPS
ncbi:HAD family hydrolase [Streptomyces sp. NPDC058122]|uniref:HAD family hydrolase n=1 Tax=Streptomyces sp. NPDC058122 TaxID=3346349 RepID=UPI0036E8E61E